MSGIYNSHQILLEANNLNSASTHNVILKKVLVTCNFFCSVPFGIIVFVALGL